MADTTPTESFDFVQRAVAEFVDIVATLADHLGDDDIRTLILADLGLDPTTGAQLQIPGAEPGQRPHLPRPDRHGPRGVPRRRRRRDPDHRRHHELPRGRISRADDRRRTA